MKRTMTMIALCAYLLSLYGCGNASVTENTEPSTAAVTSESVEITSETTMSETTVPPTTVSETTEPETIAPETTEPETTETETTAAPTEHTHKYSTEIVEATCSKNGYTLYTCDCGDRYSDDYTDILAHKVDNWETISKDGLVMKQKGTCSRCGKQQTRDKVNYPKGNYTAGVINGSYMSQNELDACAVKIHEITNKWKGLSTYDKIQSAYRYCRQNIAYTDDIPNDSSNLYGGVILGRADCWGYATTFQYLCHAMNIECYFVRASEAMHAWNIVKLDGYYYHVDPQGGLFLVSSYEYPLAFDESKYPVCDKSYRERLEEQAGSDQTEPTTEPATEPTTEPVTEPTTEPITEPTTEPATEPTTEPVTETTAEPTTEPTTEPVTESDAASTETTEETIPA